jgi:hypothetical protein
VAIMDPNRLRFAANDLLSGTKEEKDVSVRRSSQIPIGCSHFCYFDGCTLLDDELA